MFSRSLARLMTQKPYHEYVDCHSIFFRSFKNKTMRYLTLCLLSSLTNSAKSFSNRMSFPKNLKRIESLRRRLLRPDPEHPPCPPGSSAISLLPFSDSDQFIEIFDILFSARSPLVHNEVLFANKVHCLLPVLRFDLSTPGFGE